MCSYKFILSLRSRNHPSPILRRRTRRYDKFSIQEYHRAQCGSRTRVPGQDVARSEPVSRLVSLVDMNSQMSSKFPCPVVEVPVNDISIAAAYYQRRLGFSLDWHEQDIGLAGVSNGQCRLFLADPGYRKANGNIGPIIIWLNLGSKTEVDELYQAWNESDSKLLSSPESKPW